MNRSCTRQAEFRSWTMTIWWFEERLPRILENTRARLATNTAMRRTPRRSASKVGFHWGERYFCNIINSKYFDYFQESMCPVTAWTVRSLPIAKRLCAANTASIFTTLSSVVGPVPWPVNCRRRRNCRAFLRASWINFLDESLSKQRPQIKRLIKDICVRLTKGCSRSNRMYLLILSHGI